MVSRKTTGSVPLFQVRETDQAKPAAGRLLLSVTADVKTEGVTKYGQWSDILVGACYCQRNSWMKFGTGFLTIKTVRTGRADCSCRQRRQLEQQSEYCCEDDLYRVLYLSLRMN